MLISSAVRRSKASASAPALPVASHDPHGGLPKAKVDSAAAVLRGCYPTGFQETAWNGTEESIGEGQTQGLKAWFQLGLLGVDLQRKAWGQAFPGLAKATVDCVLKKIGAVKKFVLKKKKNSVTGERMQPWVKELLVVLSQQQDGVDPPPKRLSGGKAGSSASGLQKAKTKAVSNIEEVLPPPSPTSVVSIAPSLHTAVSSPVVSLQAMEEKEQSESLKKPAAAVSSSGLKRPAKKIAKVMKASMAWKPSPSFGFVKETKASSKSYIQFKKSMGEKFSLLVNVQDTASPSHKLVVDKLMLFVTSEVGLNKAQVLAKRDEIIAGWKWAGLGKALVVFQLHFVHGGKKQNRSLGVVARKAQFFLIVTNDFLF